MSILPLHRTTRSTVRRGRIISNIEVPTLPELVRTTNRFRSAQHGDRLEAHDLGSGTHTRCRISLSLLDVVATAEIRTCDVWWCLGCWPGLRCEACGAPSGDHTECALHLASTINEDKTIERGLS